MSMSLDLRGAARRERVPGPWWYLALLIAPLPLMWFGFQDLPVEWARPEYRFKSLAPVCALIVFVRVLVSLPALGRPDGHRYGLWTLVFAVLFAWIGNMVEINDVVFLAIVLYAAGALIAVLGLRTALAFWPAIGALAMMLPLPRTIYAAIHDALEQGVVTASAWVLKALSVPVYADRDNVDFVGVSLARGEAASSLLNLLPVFMVLFLFAAASHARLSARLVPFVLATPVVTGLVGLRILAIGLAAEAAGPEASAAVIRSSPDWVMFGLALLALGLAFLWIGRADRVWFSVSAWTRLRLPEDVGALRRANSSVRLGVLAAAAVSALLVLTYSHAAPVVERASFSTFPVGVGGWSGSSSRIDPDMERTLNADDYVSIDYRHPEEAAPVNFWSAFYADQRSGRRAIHTPRLCIPFDGWEVTATRTIAVAVPGEGTIEVQRMAIRRDATKAVVYFWFEGRGERTADEWRAWLQVKLNTLLQRRTDGALVRYVSALLPGEEEAQADARIQRLMADTVGHLPRVIPR